MTNGEQSNASSAATVVVLPQQMASFRESARTCPGTETPSRASLCATAQQIFRVMVAQWLGGKITQPRIHLLARQSVVRGGSGICGCRMMLPRCCRCVAGGRGVCSVCVCGPHSARATIAGCGGCTALQPGLMSGVVCATHQCARPTVCQHQLP